MAHSFMTFYSVSQEEVRHKPIKKQARKSVQGLTRHSKLFKESNRNGKNISDEGHKIGLYIGPYIEHLP